MSEQVCSVCGRSFTPPPPPMPLDLLAARPLLSTMDWHLRVKCPACGQGQDRTAKYFGALSAQQVRIIVLCLVLAMLTFVLWVLWVGVTRPIPRRGASGSWHFRSLCPAGTARRWRAAVEQRGAPDEVRAGTSPRPSQVTSVFGGPGQEQPGSRGQRVVCPPTHARNASTVVR